MQGTISTSQHIGLPGGSPICCEWKFPALSRHSPGTLNEPISKRRSKSRRLPKIRLTLSRTPRPKIRIKTTTLRNRKSRSRMPKQRTRPSSPSTAQLITSCSTNLPRRGILHRPASSILQSPRHVRMVPGGLFAQQKADRVVKMTGNTKNHLNRKDSSGFSRWSCYPDSNWRPHPYQGCALPTEL